jgi:hypothetical protein
MLALALKNIGVHLIPSLIDLQGSLAVDARMDTNMPDPKPRLRACAAEL